MKGCGKSAPRGRQRSRHGKPRREQNRIGATRGALTSAAGPCPLALSLGLVARGVRRRAPQRNGRHVGAMNPGHTEPGLQAGWRLLHFWFRLEGAPNLPTRRLRAAKKAAMLRADKVIPAGQWSGAPADTVVLGFDERHRRRVAMTGVRGLGFPARPAGSRDAARGRRAPARRGRIVEVVAEPEPLAEIRPRAPRRSFASPGISATAICRPKSCQKPCASATIR